MKAKTVQHKVGERAWQFPKLTPNDFITLSDRAYELERKRVVRDLDDAQATPEMRLVALREVDELRGLGTQVVRFALRPEGTVAVLELSIGKMNGTAPQFDELELDPTQALRLAAAIACIDLAEDDAGEVADVQDDDRDEIVENPT